VLAAVRKIEKLRASDPEVRKQLDELEGQLRTGS
jgi:hypothetical protein